MFLKSLSSAVICMRGRKRLSLPATTSKAAKEGKCRNLVCVHIGVSTFARIADGMRLGTWASRSVDRQTGRQADRQTGRQASKQADRQTGGQPSKQTGRQTDRQTGRQADSQTCIEASRQDHRGRKVEAQQDSVHLSRWPGNDQATLMSARGVRGSVSLSRTAAM
jgi:hypothetical protein